MAARPFTAYRASRTFCSCWARLFSSSSSPGFTAKPVGPLCPRSARRCGCGDGSGYRAAPRATDRLDAVGPARHRGRRALRAYPWGLLAGVILPWVGLCPCGDDDCRRHGLGCVGPLWALIAVTLLQEFGVRQSRGRGVGVLGVTLTGSVRADHHGVLGLAILLVIWVRPAGACRRFLNLGRAPGSRVLTQGLGKARHGACTRSALCTQDQALSAVGLSKSFAGVQRCAKDVSFRGAEREDHRPDRSRMARGNRRW